MEKTSKQPDSRSARHAPGVAKADADLILVLPPNIVDIDERAPTPPHALTLATLEPGKAGCRTWDSRTGTRRSMNGTHRSDRRARALNTVGRRSACRTSV